MRGRAVLLLAVSVLLNVALGTRWLLQKPPPPPALQTSAQTQRAREATPTVHTNTLVRYENFRWQDVESPDYRVFIANLRRIKVPESTIRDIIISEINQLYAHKKATNVITADQQWWRADPDPQVVQAAWEQTNALEDERRALLTELLGPAWERQSNPVLQGFSGINLSGPLLGNLSDEVRKSIQDLNARATQRVQGYIQQQVQEGKTPDPAEVQRLRRQTRDELAKVLSPAELEEYLLRYSETARNLRNEFRGVDLDPEEFRAIFRAQDTIDQYLAANASDASLTADRRQELDQQREAALRQSLPPEKYELVRLNRDPVFREARTTVEQFGAPAEAVLPLYEISHATELERQRIQADEELTPEEREEALAATTAAQRNSMRKVLGQEAYNRYVANQEAKERFLQLRPSGN